MNVTFAGERDVLSFCQGDDMPYNTPLQIIRPLDFKRALVALNTGIRGIGY